MVGSKQSQLNKSQNEANMSTRPNKATKKQPISVSKSTLPETNIAPENGWLEYCTSFLLGWPIFTGYVSFREGASIQGS